MNRFLLFFLLGCTPVPADAPPTAASQPQACAGIESCNGLDDDCDGRIDTDASGAGVCVEPLSVPAQADLLVVIDHACSQGPSTQAALADALPALVDTWNAAALDWHLGVTHMDLEDGGGRLLALDDARWLDSGTDDPATALADLVELGDHGGPLEDGLTAARRALGDLAAPEQPNAGFHRDGATLDVLVLSDTDDDGTFALDDYLDWFEALPARDRGFHGFVPGEPACPLATGPSPRYLDVMAAFDGVYSSVCDKDYAAAVAEIAARRTTTRALPLPEPVEPSSVRVEVLFAGASSPASYDQHAVEIDGLTLILPVDVGPADQVTLHFAPAVAP